MVDEVKSQFALDQEGVEPSELERITKRIQDYKIGLTPNSLQITNAMLESQLKNGLFKLTELDAVIQIRNEIVEGMGEYQTQVQNAQRRIQQLSEEDIAEKAAATSARDEAQKLKLGDERQRRKSVEDRCARLEAILASHGIHEYLDLSQEDFDSKDTLEEIAQEEEKKTEPKKPSKAFALARAMNPEGTAVEPAKPDYGVDLIEQEPSVSEVLQDELEPIPEKQAYPDLTEDDLVEWSVDEQPASVSQSEETLDFDIQEVLNDQEEEATQTELFYEEVDKIETEAQSQIEELPPTTLGSVTSAPVVSNQQLPSTEFDESDDIEAAKTMESEGGPVVDGDNITAPIKDKISLGKVKLIPDPVEEEEIDQIEIPNRPELERLTKAKIRDEADKLGFDVNTSDTKNQMIDSFETQTQQFITDLQDSGEFVSATESGDDDDDDDTRDGGYF